MAAAQKAKCDSKTEKQQDLKVQHALGMKVGRVKLFHHVANPGRAQILEYMLVKTDPIWIQNGRYRAGNKKKTIPDSFGPPPGRKQKRFGSGARGQQPGDGDH